MLTPERMFQRFPIVIVRVKAGNASENLLNKIKDFRWSSCRAREITKKL